MADHSVPSLIVLKVKSLPEIENHNMSKNESCCHICGCPFSKKGASQSQKHVCRFCYHAVCSACSPLTAIHPESNDSERICLTCYTHHLRLFIEEDDEPNLGSIIETKLNRLKEEALETYTKELERIREENKKRELAMHEQVVRLSEEVKERDERISSMTGKMSWKGDDNRNRESIEKFVNEIKALEIQNQNLKKEIEIIKENQRKYVTPSGKSGSCCVVF